VELWVLTWGPPSLLGAATAGRASSDPEVAGLLFEAAPGLFWAGSDVPREGDVSPSLGKPEGPTPPPHAKTPHAMQNANSNSVL